MKKLYIGIDAHKATKLLAYAFDGWKAPENIGRISADLNRTVDAIRKFMPKRSVDNF
ncbi:hypothetical protein [Pontiella sp.]|uniref:hypothetical protein n=1 Tax=Pontiella sp. TaxID=2837462 RepID=UPI0035699101